MTEVARERGSERAREGGTAPRASATPAVRTYRDLIAWQRGMQLAQLLYTTSRQMPREELYGLTSQMRRAAVSVPSNIAEGHARQTRQDYLRHLRIARGSLAELATQVELAVSLGYIGEEPTLQSLLLETAHVLQGLIKGLERRSLDEAKEKRRVS